MDTKLAVQTLEVMKANLLGQVTGQQAQADAIDVALQQLNGILTTQLSELDVATKENADLKEQLATTAQDAAQSASLTP